MPREYLYPELKGLSFEFFYCFSRMEFALKENKFYSTFGKRNAVKPNWGCFISTYAKDYVPSASAIELLRLAPKMQVLKDGQIDWGAIEHEPVDSELKKVIACLKTVRNNLFHGGKARDPSNRTKQLLTCGIKVIDDLAAMANLENDYEGRY